MEKKPRILVVDDEDIVVKSTIRTLQKDNYEMEYAYSGETALAMLVKSRYDLVITDLMMPGINGMEVIKRVRSDYPEITIIMFTGFATVDSAREALKLGAFDYVPKPFTPDELRDVVKNALAAKEKNSDAKMLDLMAIVSHELKSPTSVIHTTAETLHRGYFGNLDPEQQKIVESILRNCSYLEDIIRNYLDLSKMEMDNLESFQEKINLVDDVIMPVVNVPESLNNMKNMKIKTEFVAKPILQGDPNLLKIVFTNLINNAIKYGHPDSDILLRVFPSGGGYTFSILNEGVGISPEDLKDRLFKKFSRLKQKGTEGVKGSGLGLYMCKKIIEKHGWKIRAESEPGKNITFYIDFSS